MRENEEFSLMCVVNFTQMNDNDDNKNVCFIVMACRENNKNIVVAHV